MAIVGNCPKCGAPIYGPDSWGGSRPPVTYSCECRLMAAPPRTHQYCFCINDTAGTRCCLRGRVEHHPHSSTICKTDGAT